MAKATIYIRVENEAYWDKINDKSAWVNDRLQRELLRMKNLILKADDSE
jgi:hypothetical protein